MDKVLESRYPFRSKAVSMPRTAKKTKAQKEELIVLRPLSDHEKLMQEKFSESIVKQSDLVDRLSVQLFTLELAVPGLFATVVKLIGGDKTIVVMNAAFFITFAAGSLRSCSR